ncbi:T9SS type A sorting domain-containing protein [Yeosuana sp. AK3]
MKKNDSLRVLLVALMALIANHSNPLFAQIYDTEEVSMMKGVTKNIKNGWSVDPIFTVGETDSDGTDYSLDRFGYRVPGVMDGMYAFSNSNNTIDLLVSHELRDERGYAYTLANGTQLTGARISKFRIEQNNNNGKTGVTDVKLAYDKIYDRYYQMVTNQSQLDEGANPGSLDGMDRLCSANGIEAGKYGFTNNIFFSGEETGNGQVFALDVNEETLYCAPAMGRAAWESVTVMENFNTNKVVVLIGDDRAGAPLLLYIGEKNKSYGDSAPNFLKRNGLAKGSLFVWVADNGDLSPEDWNGTGTIRNGKFVKINHFNPSMAGQLGYDNVGWADNNTQDALGDAKGKFKFSRPEDVATNPTDGTQAVLASTGRPDLFPSDSWGTTYLLDLKNRELRNALKGPLHQIDNLPARLTILYDGDDAGQGQFSDPDYGLRSPDNLEWAKDGFIYINEDRSIGDFCGESGIEASVWQLNPGDGLLTRILEMDRNAVPFMQTDSAPTDCGNWESSGTIDVSHFFNSPGNRDENKHKQGNRNRNETILLLNVQAHSNDNVTDPNSPIGGDDDLSEGGQLLFASKRVSRVNNNNYKISERYDDDFDSIDIKEESQKLAYPNPAKNTLYLFEVSDIEIFDFAGYPVLQSKNADQVDITSLKMGMYVIKDSKGNSQKLIVKE